jgi:hypothetical protein
MKSSLTLLALLAACNVVAACGGVAPDDIGTDQAALAGIEGEDIDAECSAEYDDIGRITKVICPGATEAGAAKPKPSGTTIYVGGASGGVWKTTNATPTSEDAAREVDSTGTDGTTAAGTGGASGKLITYGPVITIKPKG